MPTRPSRPEPFDAPHADNAASESSDPATDERYPADSAAHSESWFRLLADSSNTAIYVYDADRLLYFNDAVLKLTGYSRDELLTKAPVDLVSEAQRPMASERLLRRLAGEDVPERFELEILRRDGQLRWFDVSTTVIEHNNRPVVLASGLDVTLARRADEALRASEQRLRLARRAGRSLTWEWNPETDELTLSGDVRDVVGLEPEVFGRTGAQFTRWVTEDDRLKVREAVERAVKYGRNLSLDVRIVLPGGSVRWLRQQAIPLRDARGWTQRLVGVTFDVTESRSALLALRESEERYRQMFQDNRAVQLLVDAESLSIVDANPAACAFYGYSFEELQAMRLADISLHSLQQLERIAAEFVSGQRSRAEAQHRLASGEERIVEVVASPLRTAGRDLIYAIIQDITERKLAEEELAAEKERALVTLESIGDGVIRTDGGGRIDYLNTVAARLTGWSSEEARGRMVSEVFNVVDEDSRRTLTNSIDRCLREGRTIETPNRMLLLRRDGQEYSIRDSAAPIRDRSGHILGAVLVFKDVTQLRGMEREMHYLTRHDVMTGLLNRQQFEVATVRAIEDAQRAGASHAIGHLDIDGFKVINDAVGHLAGDEMLKQVASLLEATVRPNDLVARLGGDEFGLLLRDATPAEAIQLAQRCVQAFKNFRFRWQSRSFEVSASLGLAPIAATERVDEESRDLAQVMSNADAARYIAQESGGNRVHVYRPDDRAVAERSGELQWIHKIHDAFDESRFELYAQSIHSLANHEGDDGEDPDSGSPRLAEIFIRMRDRDGRLVAPGGFIPAAERYRLIPSIDRWVLTNAFRRLAGESTITLGDDAAAEHFTLNLSGQSLGNETFLDFVTNEIETSGVDPTRICFEITETAAIANFAQASRFIAVLKGIGCRFVLDDFGSGLSSFAYLKNLPVDFLKIDGEFIRDMVEQPVQRALVKSIHQIGHVLGIETIAEAIETQETYDLLRVIGVDYGQGYYLGRPVPLSN